MTSASLSTHVLDTSTGAPGANVTVDLYLQDGERWTLLHSGSTSDSGRYADFAKGGDLGEGVYKLRFDVASYYKGRSVDTLYPYVEVVFKVRAGQHYHIPLILSPFGYSTYRGS